MMEKNPKKLYECSEDGGDMKREDCSQCRAPVRQV